MLVKKCLFFLYGVFVTHFKKTCEKLDPILSNLYLPPDIFHFTAKNKNTCGENYENDQ